MQVSCTEFHIFIRKELRYFHLTFWAYSKKIYAMRSQWKIIIFGNFSEKFTEEFRIKRNNFSASFTFHMFMMMFMRIHFILFRSWFKTDSTKNSNLCKKFDTSKNACAWDMRKIYLNVFCAKEMKFLHFLKKRYSFRSDAFLLLF